MAVKKRLGEMLVEAGIIDETQLGAALGHQRQWGGRLGHCLIEMKLASEESIVDALAVKFGYEVAQLDQLEPYAFEQAKALLPREYATRNRIFPIAADTGVLTVAMSDPTNLSLTDELAFKSGRRIKVCIAGENAIAAAVRLHYGEDLGGAREAIALDADDGAAVDPIYDPIGATSSEQMSRFYQQGPAAAAAAARAAATPAPVKPATPAARSASPSASPAQSQRPRTAQRSPKELQLEDQPTGSHALEPETTASILLQHVEHAPASEEPAEELQPLDGEPLTPEDAAYAEGAAYPEGAAYVEGESPREEEWVEGPVRPRELSLEESMILDELGRLAVGDDAVPTIVRPAQLLATLIRLLLRKQLITEQELLDEILRK
jgi:hypothetical protein